MGVITPEIDRETRRDLRTLARFVLIYCRHYHMDATKTIFDIKTLNVEEILRKPVQLCPECTKLLAHAFIKRSTCPMEPKPACKHCPNHCYHPTYRAKIREVMKYSGRILVLTGRLDMLIHLFF